MQLTNQLAEFRLATMRQTDVQVEYGMICHTGKRHSDISLTHGGVLAQW